MGKNRIVVDYGDMEELILLGAVHTKSGEEMKYDSLKEINGHSFGFPIVKKYTGMRDFEFMKLMNIDNKEGYVIRFSSGFRMKIKFEEYCRLHSIVTNVSNKIIWENLKDGNSFEELLTNVPDEFYGKVKYWVDKLNVDFIKIKIDAIEEYINIINTLIKNKIPFSKKEFASYAVKSNNSSILFNIYDNKEYEHIIWEKIKPEYSKLL